MASHIHCRQCADRAGAGNVPGAYGLALLLVSRLLDFATVAGSLAVACLALGAAGTLPALTWLTPLGPRKVCGFHSSSSSVSGLARAA